MKHIRLVFSLLTLFIIVFSSACGKNSPEPAADDIVQTVAGIPGDTVFITVDGIEISAEQYLYLAAQAMDSLYQYGSETYDINQDDSEFTWIDKYWEIGMEPAVLNMIENYCMAQAHAGEYGLTVDRAEFDEAVDMLVEDAMAYYEDEEAFSAALSQMCMTVEGYRGLAEKTAWYRLLYDHLYNENGEFYPSDEEVILFADDNGYYHCKYVYLSTTGQYTEEAVEKVHERALGLFELIENSEDPDAEITKYISDPYWNEDDTESEDGLLTAGGWLDAVFDEGVRAMKAGEIALIDDSADYGYFVTERLSVDPAAIRSVCSQSLYTEQISEWAKQAAVTYSDTFKSFDFRQFYINLTDYRMSSEMME